MEAKSFGSETIDVSLVTQSIDGTIMEGCTDAILSLSLGAPRATATDIDLTLLGDAINGVDFENINNTITIPAGQTTENIAINAIDDGLPEGIEELLVAVQVNSCRTDTFSLYFNDFALPAPVVDDVDVCPGNSVSLDGALNITVPSPVTINSESNNMLINSPLPGQIPSSTISSLDVVGVQPLQLGPDVIQSVCINIDHNRVEDLDIYLRAPGGQLIPLSSDNGALGDNYTNTCFRPDAIGNIVDAIAPFSGSYQPEGNWPDLWYGDSPLNGTWELEVIDDASGFSGILVDWEITFNPVFSLNYDWSPGTGLSCTDCPTTIVTPNITTTYTVIATDAFGCTRSDDATVYILAPDFAEAGTNQSICTSSSATLTASGGVSYEWSTSETTTSITVSPAITTTYTVTVTSSGGCTDTDEVQVLVGNALSIDLDKSDISCGGLDDGIITANPTGGQAPFDYMWSNGASSATISNLSALTYAVTVTDVNGCSNTNLIEILDPLPIQIQMNSLNTCEGATEGEVSVLVMSGGVSPYGFLWDASTGNQVTSTVSDLGAGVYSVTVSDNNDCTIVGSTTVESIDTVMTPILSCGNVDHNSITVVWLDDPNAISFEINVDNNGWETPSDNLAHTINGLSLDQSVMIEVRSNGVCNSVISSITCSTMNCTPITFSVQNITNVSCFDANDGVVSLIASGDNPPFTYTLNTMNNTTGDFTDLEPGNYTATVEDDLGCSNAVSFTILEPEELNVTGQVINQPGCITQGEITSIVSGGTYPYTFVWNNAQTDSIMSGLNGGLFIVTVTDDNGCTGTDSIELPDYFPMSVSMDVENMDCSGSSMGAIAANVQGGEAPFSYLWDDPLAQTTVQASNLEAGIYTVTISDNLGCTIAQTASVEIPEQLFLDSITSTPVLCYGEENGNAAVFLSGGTGSMNYNWSNNANTASISNLTTGNYSVTVIDDNGCTVTSSVEVAEPEDIVVVMTPVAVSCFEGNDGMINVEVSGGLPSYFYNWNNNSETEDLDNLEAGTYSLTISDMNGCSEVLTTEVISPSELMVSLAIQSPACVDSNSGRIEAIVGGGSPNYQYEWSTSLVEINIISDLAPGNYTLTVTDNNNCMQVVEAIVEAGEDINIEYSAESPACEGDLGIIFVQPVGGTDPYTVIMDGVEYYEQLEFQDILPGAYSIELIDANGCSAMIDDVIIENASPIDVELGEYIKLGIGDSILLTPQIISDNGALNYQWSDNVSCPTCPTTYISPLQSTTVSLTVTDENGCVDEASIRVFVDQTDGVYIPNSFSPDGDEFNDFFTVYTREGGHVEELRIYSRWGECVFAKSNFDPNIDNLGWDGRFKGKPLNPGVYVYFARVSFNNSPDQLHKGEITLVK